MDIESFAIGLKVGAKSGNSTSGGGLVVTITNSGGYYIMDKTWQEIHDAFGDGNIVVARYVEHDTTETGETYQETIDSVTSVSENYVKESGEFVDHNLSVYTSFLGGFEAQSKTDYPIQEIW